MFFLKGSFFLLMGFFLYCCTAKANISGGTSVNCVIEDVLEESADKVYVEAEQLFISNEGIFLFDYDSWISVSQLRCDEKGLYCLVTRLDRIIDKCVNGHKIWCRRCGGCVTRWCKFRCKCVEWE